MPDQVRPDTSVEATARLRAAFLAQPVEESQLKIALCDYVDEAKSLGWPIERIIIYVKRLAELDSRSDALHDPLKRAEAQGMLARAVTLCVQHYYWSGDDTRR